MSRGRIAYLVSEYPHIRHSYLLREIRGLRKLGWEIETVALRPETRGSDNFTAEEREERAACFYILGVGPGRIVGAHLATLLRHPLGYVKGLAQAIRYGRFHPRTTMYGVFYFAEAVVAGRWMEKRGVRHVHTHYATNIAWLMGRIFPVEISMSIHGSGEFDDPKAFWLTEKIVSSQFIRAISCFGRSQIMRACPDSQWDKIDVCRLGVDVGDPPQRTPRRSEDPFHLLCVGGMAPPRAFHMLIRALALLEDKPVKLTLIGDGPDRPRLEALARECGVADRVRFEGWRTQDELPAYYASADAFVFSSFAEGIPVVLMEAMANALPCVAPRIAGIPELIRDGVDGFLTAPSDEHEIAAAIDRLRKDPQLCDAMGASARARVLDLFHLERNIEELSESLRRRLSVAEQPGTRGLVRDHSAARSKSNAL